MKKTQKILILFFVFFFSLTGSSEGKKEIQMIRVSGRSRYETAAKVSDVIYEKQAKNVVIVSGENYPDGLTGGVLASLVDGPVLLTSKDQLPLATSNEIRRIKPEKIYILGGQGSVSQGVEKQLAKFGKIIRLSGGNRYETAEKVANYIYSLSSSQKKYLGLANGLNFPDALAAAGYFANIKTPFALTDSSALAAPTGRLIKNHNIGRIIAVGGEGSLPESILPSQVSVKRLSGGNRYTTSVNIAKEGFKTSKWAIITSGENYPDALASAPLAHHLKAPILLAHKGQLPADVVQYIEERGIEQILVVGGKEGLPDKIFDQLNIKKPNLPIDPEAPPIG